MSAGEFRLLRRFSLPDYGIPPVKAHASAGYRSIAKFTLVGDNFIRNHQHMVRQGNETGNRVRT